MYLVKYNGLVKDTAILNATLRSNAITKKADSTIISQQKNIIAEDSVELYDSKQISKSYKSDYEVLDKKYVKETKKNKRVKTAFLSMLMVAIVETIIIILK